MDEFGAQLDRRRFAGRLQRVGAAADPIPRLENDGIYAAFVQTPGGGKPRGAGAYDCYIRFDVRHRYCRSRKSV